MNLSACFKVAIIAIPFTLLAGCKTPPSAEECTSQPVAVSCTRLTIENTVPTSSKYPATMLCSGLKDVKVLSGGFRWNGEGPYEYKPSRVKAKTDEIVFNLRTGNPGIYEIVGVLTYRDSAGCEQKTKPVSAGRIRAK